MTSLHDFVCVTCNTTLHYGDSVCRITECEHLRHSNCICPERCPIDQDYLDLTVASKAQIFTFDPATLGKRIERLRENRSLSSNCRNIGWVSAQNGDHKVAFDWYRKAQKRKPTSVQALFDLARCYREGVGVASNGEQAEKYRQLAQNKVKELNHRNDQFRISHQSDVERKVDSSLPNSEHQSTKSREEQMNDDQQTMLQTTEIPAQYPAYANAIPTYPREKKATENQQTTVGTTASPIRYPMHANDTPAYPLEYESSSMSPHVVNESSGTEDGLQDSAFTSPAGVATSEEGRPYSERPYEYSTNYPPQRAIMPQVISNGNSDEMRLNSEQGYEYSPDYGPQPRRSVPYIQPSPNVERAAFEGPPFNITMKMQNAATSSQASSDENNGGHVTEIYASKTGHKIATYTWLPSGGVAAASGAVILLHGLHRHSMFDWLEPDGANYHNRLRGSIVAAFLDAGLAVFAYDQPGHGRTAGKHGYVDSLDMLRDIAVEITRAKTGGDLLGKRRFVVGMGLGATVAIMVAQEQPNLFDGMCLVSPAVQEPDGKFGWTGKMLIAVNKPISRLLPKVSGIKLPMSDDRLVRDAVLKDPLVYKGGLRMRLGQEFLRVYKDLRENASNISIPRVIAVLGANNTIISPSGFKTFFDRIQSDDKTCVMLENTGHEVLREPGCEKVRDDLVDWILERIGNRTNMQDDKSEDGIGMEQVGGTWSAKYG